jgi:membrane protease YdiL (CAAX protease family)
MLVTAFLCYFVFSLFGLEKVSFVDVSDNDKDTLLIGLVAILIAPLFETMLLQAFPFYILSLFPFFQKRKALIVFISALIFCIGHYNTLVRIISGFFVGGALSAVFILREKNKGFLIVYLSHLIWNLVVVIVKIMNC